MPSQSPHVPKFGDWYAESGEQQFTLIFNNMHAHKSMKGGNPNDPAFLAELMRNPLSASSEVAVHDVGSPPPPLPSPPDASPPSPVKPTFMNHKSQSPRMPKFGDWDGESGEQQFTLIFNNMHAYKGMKRGNPNDPAFLAELLNPSSASSEAAIHDVGSPPPLPSQDASPPPPVNKPTSINHKQNQYPHVPKFGDWNLDGESGGQQEFTLIFDKMDKDKSMKRVNPNDPAFLPGFANSSSSSSNSPSQATMQVMNQLPSPPLRHESSRPSLKPTSRSAINHKKGMAPKFADWDSEHPEEYTAMFDELKQEKSGQHASTHGPKRSTFPTTPFTTHRPFCVNWRLCFRSGQAVRD